MAGAHAHELTCKRITPHSCCLCADRLEATTKYVGPHWAVNLNNRFRQQYVKCGRFRHVNSKTGPFSFDTSVTVTIRGWYDTVCIDYNATITLGTTHGRQRRTAWTFSGLIPGLAGGAAPWKATSTDRPTPTVVKSQGRGQPSRASGAHTNNYIRHIS